MKQMIPVQANSPSVRFTENLLVRLQIMIGFRAWKQFKKVTLFSRWKSWLFIKNSVLVYALIGVANARYIRLSLSFDY